MPAKCRCGCRKEVKWNKQKKRWNTLIHGHWFRYYNKTKAHSEKVSANNKKRVLSEETKKKISNSLQGHVRSEESKRKQSITMIDREVGRKENNSAWNGGISPYKNTGEWVKLSKEIKKRDNYICQECRSKNLLTVHHIDFTKSNHSPLNLITLCKQCHATKHKEHGDYKRSKPKLRRNK